MKFLILAFSFFPLLVSTDDSESRGKSFSLFNVVQFKNEACQAVSDTTLKGVCYTSQECSDLGGTSDGNCANGFGTCCIIIVSGTTASCGGTVTQNCSYIQNVNFPSAETATATCTYMVTKCSSEICQIRLDFVTAGLGQPTAATGACDGDNLVITPGVGSLAGANPPTLCGTLTGQHVYIDAGTGTNAATLALTTAATPAADGTKSWRIKVSQIECTSIDRAPPGCLQWFRGVTNVFTSFNWDGTSTTSRELANQNYKICFRQEEGMCKIKYDESPIGNAAVDAFELGATGTIIAGQHQQSRCCTNMNACLIINGAEEMTTDDFETLGIYCGGVLNNIYATDATKAGNTPATVTASAIPFEVRHIANGAALDNTLAGFSLQATQIPCGRSDGA